MSVKQKAPRTLATFRAAHDRETVITNKIRAALEALAKEEGPEGYAYESNDAEGRPTMLKRAGISLTDLALYREQFSAYIVELSNNSRDRGKRVWFATPKAAKAARGG